ncbi:uncharacterized protein TNCV_5010661 [Trichonephila clavipes]|nr:uncharacterized protein TNCV_5010661 [Trichonephila clavipes]
MLNILFKIGETIVSFYGVLGRGSHRLLLPHKNLCWSRDYGCEVVTRASTTNFGKYDVVQYSALRIIIGGVKSALITAMQLLPGIEPLDSRRDKVTLKFWQRVRSVNYGYWNENRYTTQKTQTSPLSHAERVMKKRKLPLLITRRAPIQFYSIVAIALPFKRLDLTNKISNKADAIPEE